ncbi:entericidin A/B family lipoprotein [Leclercia barmai]
MMVIASTMLSGCNTARGVGEDIKSLGSAISHAAS